MKATLDLESRRMELRGIVRESGEILARYWPIRTFVHHNPLHSLESSPFEDAVRIGREVLGGKGYLAGRIYRQYLRSGRIKDEHLDAALGPVARDEHIVVGPCRISHHETLKACLTRGLCEPEDDSASTGRPDDPIAVALADRLTVARPSLDVRIDQAMRGQRSRLGRFSTLSRWCDRTIGSDLVSRVNDELVKWCGAFLDEGHATWAMPGREAGFYQAWKTLAAHQWSTCQIQDSRKKIAELPEHPEDAVLESLEALGIPSELRQDYLTAHLAELPGWAGFIKWRADQRDYPWQQAYPISLVKYLAVRLWYERHLVGRTCADHLGSEGTYAGISAFLGDRPHEAFLRQEKVAGRLPVEISRLLAGARPGDARWKQAAERLEAESGPAWTRALRMSAAHRLLGLAQALDIVPGVLLEGDPEALSALVAWMDGFPEPDHGPVWLRALEAGYREHLLGLLARTSSSWRQGPPDSVRPQSQSIFCIDIRTEPFRRHLESAGNHETLGCAAFFAAPIRYREWGKSHYTDQFPAVMQARNEVRELPRAYLEHVVPKHQSRAQLLQAGHTLLHDLKENVVTPYVMVESLGWFYGLPLVAKTLWPAMFRRLTTWLEGVFVPPIATNLTVDKLGPADIDEMLAAEQRSIVWKALRDQLGLRSLRIVPRFVEALRLHALSADDVRDDPALLGAAREVGLGPDALASFVSALRKEYRIEARSASRQKERLTRAGFTLDEQVVTVETVLRMIGLVGNFARLVLLCGHGSTSDNNPFESALNCGACGGNEGKPNARVVAAMANHAKVRERLRQRGLEIPDDTWFLSGQLDTTTYQVQLFDLEDVPPTHRRDVVRLEADLAEATLMALSEQLARLPDVGAPLPARRALAHARVRSADWSQTRPEWGLSGNTAIVIGPRETTKGLNLAGRVFLHSYDHRVDPGGRMLEVILTGAQLVAQWICMEHYFSAVDNEVYGASSKVYHNVVGRLGVMSGPRSDLRVGLANQTVLAGDRPYHEPMRLLTVVEAHRSTIEALIARHDLLQNYYHNDWVRIVALEPADGRLYSYRPTSSWAEIPLAPHLNPQGKESAK